MNYCTITIKDQTIGLKFGMASFRYLSENKFVEGKAFVKNELNEIGIAYVLYSGYYNNCLVKEMPLSLTFEDFVDHVEMSMLNKSYVNEIINAVKMWSDNEYLKTTQIDDEPKKKKTRGKI